MKLFLLINTRVEHLSRFIRQFHRDGSQARIISAIIAAPDAETARSTHPDKPHAGSLVDWAQWTDAQHIKVVEIGEYNGPFHLDGSTSGITLHMTVFVEDGTIAHLGSEVLNPGLFAMQAAV
jgi:hypothetical protein